MVKKTKVKKDEIITLRINSHEKKMIEYQAFKMRISVACFVRNSVMNLIE